MKILDFLLKNPILLFVIGAWLVGVIGNVLKKSEQRRRNRGPARTAQPAGPAQQSRLPSQAQRTLPQQSIPSQAQPMPQRTPIGQPRPTVAAPSPPPATTRSAEEVAREMRRILGLEPAPGPLPSPPLPEPPPVRRAPIAPPIERPPQPITISTRDRKLELHGDSHVGEGLRERHLDQRRRQPVAHRLGDLGGRVRDQVQRRRKGSRFALDDLKRAVVFGEILAPPVSLRPFDQRRGH